MTKTVRKIFIVLFIIVFADMLGLGIISPFMAIFSMEEMGATGIWLGIIYGSLSFTRVISLPTVGLMSDSYGRKKFISIGLFAYTLLALAFVGASNVYHLTGIRLVRGVASAMVVPVARAYAAELSPEGEEGRYMGLFNVAFSMGMGSGPLLGGILIQYYDYTTMFYTMSGLWAFPMMIALLFLPEQKGKRVGQTVKESSASFRKLLRDRMMRGIFIWRLVVAVGSGSIMVFFPVYALWWHNFF